MTKPTLFEATGNLYDALRTALVNPFAPLMERFNRALRFEYGLLWAWLAWFGALLGAWWMVFAVMLVMVGVMTQ